MSMVMDGGRQTKARQHPWTLVKARFAFLRMKLAIRSRSFCMIWEGLASSEGQIKRWQCSGIRTWPTMRKPSSARNSASVVMNWRLNLSESKTRARR
jgi:hypothetical protein